MAFRAVVFDLDGTLLDTLDDIAAACNRVLARHGFATHAAGDYRAFVGEGAQRLIEQALPADARGPERVAACLAGYVADYGANWKVATRPYPGVAALLDALVLRGVRRAVLSNKPHAITGLCVAELLAPWTFDAVLGTDGSLPRKPDPAGALRIASELGLAPSEFLYLGDSGIDMRTARAAGMFPCGALWGFRSRAELEESGALALAAHPRDVIRLLG